MKYSALGNVCVGIVCMMVISCSNSELSTTPESQVAVNDEQLEDQNSMESIQAPVSEDLTTYLQGVEDQLGHLKEKHATLVNSATKAEPGSQSRVSLDVRLAELTKKGEEIQFQIEAMKAATGEDHAALQTGMGKTLEELAESYDNALAEFAG